MNSRGGSWFAIGAVTSLVTAMLWYIVPVLMILK